MHSETNTDLHVNCPLLSRGFSCTQTWTDGLTNRIKYRMKYVHFNNLWLEARQNGYKGNGAWRENTVKPAKMIIPLVGYLSQQEPCLLNRQVCNSLHMTTLCNFATVPLCISLTFLQFVLWCCTYFRRQILFLLIYTKENKQNYDFAFSLVLVWNFLSKALREEHWPRVFENRMLRIMLGSKRAEIIEGWRKIHNEALRNMNSLAITTRMIESRRMRFAGHVAHTA